MGVGTATAEAQLARGVEPKSSARLSSQYVYDSPRSSVLYIMIMIIRGLSNFAYSKYQVPAPAGRRRHPRADSKPFLQLDIIII